MTQLIIVIIIVAAAFGVAAYKIYLRLFSKNKAQSACNGCTGCDLKKELQTRQKGCFEHPEQRKKWTEK